MDYTAMRFWMDVIVIIAVAGNTVYTWFANREKVNATRLKAHEAKVNEKLTEHESRCSRHRELTGSLEGSLGRLQTEVHHLPSQADIGRVHARMDEVYGLVKGLDGELKGSRRQLDLVLEELLRRDK